MSDLISRSQLLKEIETWGGCVEALHEYIQNMPTAYSVDKVVEEIEEYGKNTDVCISKKNAIEIVKKGGVSDDVCEWKTNDNQHMFSMWETECGTQTMIQKLPSYKYCPYCGKKIKVV